MSTRTRAALVRIAIALVVGGGVVWWLRSRTSDSGNPQQDQKLVAQQQVDEYAAQIGQYEGSVKVDLAAVENAQLQLDYAIVKAPIDGVTGVRLVDEGNLVKASDPGGLVVITAVNPAAV